VLLHSYIIAAFFGSIHRAKISRRPTFFFAGLSNQTAAFVFLGALRIHIALNLIEPWMFKVAVFLLPSSFITVKCNLMPFDSTRMITQALFSLPLQLQQSDDDFRVGRADDCALAAFPVQRQRIRTLPKAGSARGHPAGGCPVRRLH